MLENNGKSTKNQVPSIPAYIFKKWNIQVGDDLYAHEKDGCLMLSKTPSQHAIIMPVTSGFHLMLKDAFLCGQAIRQGDGATVTLEDDMLHAWLRLYGEDAQTESLKTLLREKAEKEYEALNPTRQSELLEDIYMFLLLTPFDDETIQKLLIKPNLLQGLCLRLLDDDDYADFLERKLQTYLQEITSGIWPY